MKWFRFSGVFVGLTMMSPALAGAQVEPVTYKYVPIYSPVGVYDAAGYVATPQIIEGIDEVLDAIDSPQRRSELAQQWLQFSRQTIARDQEFREKWLELQKQQLRQQQQAEQHQLEVAQLQMRIEELRAENLRLERENLQLKLAQERGGRSAAQLP